jgi:hypothetical protein
MQSRRPRRFWVEIILGMASAALLAVTLVWPDWIERAFDLAPDGGDGSAEWGWAAGFAIATLVCFLGAGRTWRRSARVPAASR